MGLTASIANSLSSDMLALTFLQSLILTLHLDQFLGVRSFMRQVSTLPLAMYVKEKELLTFHKSAAHDVRRDALG
jgi:hypothetical protein